MLKVLHCADIHLDSPFSAETPEKAELRRHELRKTFTSMMTYAKVQGVDIVLIAGDLFDREFVTRDTVACVLHEFSSNPACRFFITPGNHDPYTEGSVYQKVAFPPNVTIFSKEELTRVPIESLQTDVYGYAFRSPILEENPFAGKQPANPDRINILCAHGSFNMPHDRCCPIMPEDVADSGFDYYAFGHYHNTDGIHAMGNKWYGYSGCPEGRDFGETGYKGAVLATLSKENGRLKADFRQLRFSQRRYEILTINLTGLNDSETGYQMVAEKVQKAGYESDTILRIVLEGSVAPRAVLSHRKLRTMLDGHFFSLEIEDHTLPLFDEETLKNDPTLRGAFYAALMPMLQSGNSDERETAALALRYGLAAMEGSDLSFD